MRHIKKYQQGGSIGSSVPKGAKAAASKYKPMRKSPTPKKAVDLSAPGKGMMEELQKKGAMPASQTNIGRRGIKVGKARGGKQMLKQERKIKAKSKK